MGTGETNEMRRKGRNELPLEIDEDVPESVARAINRWPTMIISNDGDDDRVWLRHASQTERFKTKQHMRKKRWAGFAKKFHGGTTTVMWVSRESPDGACQLARTHMGAFCRFSEGPQDPRLILGVCPPVFLEITPRFPHD